MNYGFGELKVFLSRHVSRVIGMAQSSSKASFRCPVSSHPCNPPPQSPALLPPPLSLRSPQSAGDLASLVINTQKQSTGSHSTLPTPQVPCPRPPFLCLLFCGWTVSTFAKGLPALWALRPPLPAPRPGVTPVLCSRQCRTPAVLFLRPPLPARF